MYMGQDYGLIIFVKFIEEGNLGNEAIISFNSLPFQAERVLLLPVSVRLSIRPSLGP